MDNLSIFRKPKSQNRIIATFSIHGSGRGEEHKEIGEEEKGKQTHGHRESRVMQEKQARGILIC